MDGRSDELLREILSTVKVIAEEQVAMRKDISVLQKGQETFQKVQDRFQEGSGRPSEGRRRPA